MHFHENYPLQLIFVCMTGPQQQDFCAQFEAMTGEEYCKNEGECQNQCLGPVCLCKAPYIAGNRCDGCKYHTNSGRS